MKVEVGQSSAVMSLMKRRGKLSEAQLFGAVMSDKVANHTSVEVAQEFKKNFRQAKRDNREKVGSRGVVEAAMFALDKLEKGGKISSDCSKVLTSESWTLSQLDNNPNDVGSRKEMMNGGVSRSSGIEQYQQRNSLYECGELSLTAVSEEMLKSQRGASTASGAKASKIDSSAAMMTKETGSLQQAGTPDSGNSAIYQRGFLFKPVSDSTGKVAILMPPSLTGKVQSVSIYSNNRVENGNYGGVGNGFREHFRFSEPGSKYPPNSQVRVTLYDGTTHNVTIPNPLLRYEVK